MNNVERVLMPRVSAVALLALHEREKSFLQKLRGVACNKDEELVRIMNLGATAQWLMVAMTQSVAELEVSS